MAGTFAGKIKMWRFARFVEAGQFGHRLVVMADLIYLLRRPTPIATFWPPSGVVAKSRSNQAA
jgi:hypothetical protein